MKTFNYLKQVLVFILLLLAMGCEKDEDNNEKPTLSTGTATQVGTTTATLNATITSNGGSTITKRGFYWTTHNSPGSSDTETVVSGTDPSFTSVLSSLQPGTTYYYRAYATNSVGTSTGDVKSFTTLATLPVVTTGEALSITETTTELKGTISNNGGADITRRGFYWATHNNPGSGDSETVVSGSALTFIASLSSLQPGTTYYYRAYATNSVGTIAGEVKSFTTLATLPTVTTNEVLNITGNTAELKGTVSDNGGADITRRGFYWATHNNPGSGDSETVVSGSALTFIAALSGLQPGTTYYYRAFATNSAGTSTGEVKSFIATNPTGTMTDIDGNTYQTVQIGDQWWMAENLKVTKYANGTSIPHITDDSAWDALYGDKGYCFYNNDASLGYGVLYTFFTATNGIPHSGSAHVQGVCPEGWHLPSDSEWTQLENYMIANGYNYYGTTSGNKIGKALASKTGWESTSDIGSVGNSPATNNSSGFNALPGGYRREDYGTFRRAGYDGFWWSSTQHDILYAYFRSLWYGGPYLTRNYSSKSRGSSVRCVKD